MTVELKLDTDLGLFHSTVLLLAVEMHRVLALAALDQFLALPLVCVSVKLTIVRITMAINW